MPRRCGQSAPPTSNAPLPLRACFRFGCGWPRCPAPPPQVRPRQVVQSPPWLVATQQAEPAPSAAAQRRVWCQHTKVAVPVERGGGTSAAMRSMSSSGVRCFGGWRHACHGGLAALVHREAAVFVAQHVFGVTVLQQAPSNEGAQDAVVSPADRCRWSGHLVMRSEWGQNSIAPAPPHQTTTNGSGRNIGGEWNGMKVDEGSPEGKMEQRREWRALRCSPCAGGGTRADPGLRVVALSSRSNSSHAAERGSVYKDAARYLAANAFGTKGLGCGGRPAELTSAYQLPARSRSVWLPFGVLRRGL